MPTFIYGLCDPRTGDLRYVGKTTQVLQARLTRHINQKGKDHRSCWVQSLIRAGVKPDIFVIEEVGRSDTWEAAEQHYIAYFKALGCSLVNSCSGGRGTSSPSAETREKMSLAKKGKKLSDDHRASLRKAIAERDPVYSAEIIRTRKKRIYTPEQRAVLAERFRVLPASVHPRGEKHPAARLTAEDVRNIRILLKTAKPQTEIAEEYGISTSGLQHIKNYKTWKHVLID